MVAMAAHPASAVACPACYAALGSRTLGGYYLSTAFLSLLPFAIVAALTLVGRRLQQRFREPEHAPPPVRARHDASDPCGVRSVERGSGARHANRGP